MPLQDVQRLRLELKVKGPPARLPARLRLAHRHLPAVALPARQHSRPWRRLAQAVPPSAGNARPSALGTSACMSAKAHRRSNKPAEAQGAAHVTRCKAARANNTPYSAPVAFGGEAILFGLGVHHCAVVVGQPCLKLQLCATATTRGLTQAGLALSVVDVAQTNCLVRRKCT